MVAFVAIVDRTENVGAVPSVDLGRGRKNSAREKPV